MNGEKQQLHVLPPLNLEIFMHVLEALRAFHCVILCE